jgi:type VI secretion system secreted protein VgrG
MDINIDIDTTFKVLLVLIVITIVVALIGAFRSISAARKLQFFKKRQDLIERGWRLVVLTLILGAIAFVLVRFGEPVAYRYFPPSPTITRTPTITTTPTITLTLRETYTPTITLTLAQTYTPALPDVVQTAIKTPVGVDNNAIFSVIEFSTQIDKGVLFNTTDVFNLPISQMYAGFSWDKMALGVQWSAVWLYEGEVICFESEPWKDSTGGYAGYSDACNSQLTPDQWKPGNYEVQIFVGQTFKTSGRFLIAGGDQVEPTPSLTPTP